MQSLQQHGMKASGDHRINRVTADLVNDACITAQANEDGFEQLQGHSVDLLLEVQYCTHPLFVELLCTKACSK